MRLILFCCLLLSGSSIRFRERPEKKSPYPNVHEMDIDISNNNTYKGRIFNGSLVVNDYTNMDFIDPTLTEEDYDNLYDMQTYSYKSSECNFNKKILLDRHNFLRTKHNASALKWDLLLEQRAKHKASYYEKMQCPKRRDDPKEYGMLVFNGFGTIYTEEEIVNHFYEGAYHWKWDDLTQNDFAYNFYDFAQILWKSTKSFGCAKACCLTNQIWVCLYNPSALANDLTEIESNIEGPVANYQATFA